VIQQRVSQPAQQKARSPSTQNQARQSSSQAAASEKKPTQPNVRVVKESEIESLEEEASDESLKLSVSQGTVAAIQKTVRANLKNEYESADEDDNKSVKTHSHMQKRSRLAEPALMKQQT